MKIPAIRQPLPSSVPHLRIDQYLLMSRYDSPEYGLLSKRQVSKMAALVAELITHIRTHIERADRLVIGSQYNNQRSLELSAG